MGRNELCGRPRVRGLRSQVVAALLAGTVALAAGGPAAGAALRYRVRPGDTLSGIAAAHRTTIEELAGVNRLDPNGVLLAGGTLRLPEPARSALVSYRVEPGDTLSGIAVRSRTSVQTIARLNRLDPAGLLLAGQTLLLPWAAVSQPTEGAAGSTSSVRASIILWADHYAVNRALALAVAWMESGDHPGLTSSAGAWGVMQVTPVTWAYAETVLIGRAIPRTTEGGIRVGVAYVHHLLHAFAGDERLALAAYLQGERSVRKNGILASSRYYVDDVLALASRMDDE
jgi:N-acetylmuramoyl-L-alanine amidase